MSRAKNVISRVVWDEVAVTYKPINDGLRSVSIVPFGEFAKALYAGNGINPETMVGGRVMIPESLRGKPVNIKKIGKDLFGAIRAGKIKKSTDIKTFLKERDIGHLFKPIATYVLNNMSRIRTK